MLAALVVAAWGCRRGKHFGLELCAVGGSGQWERCSGKFVDFVECVKTFEFHVRLERLIVQSEHLFLWHAGVTDVQ